MVDGGAIQADFVRQCCPLAEGLINPALQVIEIGKREPKKMLRIRAKAFDRNGKTEDGASAIFHTSAAPMPQDERMFV